MPTTYMPIACALYDKFEIAIMQKKPMRIQWRDEHDKLRQEMILASDILVKNKEEFLVAKSLLVNTSDESELFIRLDKITLLT